MVVNILREHAHCWWILLSCKELASRTAVSLATSSVPQILLTRKVWWPPSHLIVSVRSAFVSVRSAFVSVRSAFVSVRSAFVSVRSAFALVIMILS